MVLLIARIGLPESPRWLWTERRFDEAHAIAHKYMVDAAEMTDVEHEDTHTGGFGMLFSRDYWRMTVPRFVVLVLQRPAPICDRDVRRRCAEAIRPRRRPRSRRNDDGRGGRGCRHDRVDRQRFCRRVFTVPPQWIVTVVLIVGLRSGAPPGRRAGSVPALLVPECHEWGADEHLSRRGVPHRGPWSRHRFRCRCQLAGAGLGTFLLPITIENFGVSATILAMSVIVFSGAPVSQLWPETKG